MNMKKISILLFLYVLLYTNGHAQKPPITPAWAFEHIAWEDSINTSYGAVSLIEEYLKRNIPVGGIIIDSPWSDGYNDFNWDKERYPDHENMIRYFKEKDIKVILWLTGATNFKSRDTRIQKAANYDHAVSKNYGINNSKPGKWWKGEGIHIDFTNEKAKKWWFTQLDKVFVDGVYGWKVDQGEVWYGDTILTSKGIMTNEEFRPYYYDAMYDYTISRNKAGINLSRPYSHQGGFEASVEKMNLGWCGDFSGNWKGLKLQIDNIYRSVEKGYGAPGCEVAGFFMERSNKKQFVRYAQFGSMTASMINGGENGAFSNHLPWWHGKDVEDIYRFCVVLHDQLIPYLFSTVVDAHLKGGSLLKNVSYQEESHQVGDQIFTKAITSDDDKVTCTLPANGDWIDFWTGEKHAGNTVITRQYPLNQFPLYFKSGSIIPMRIDCGITGIGDATMAGKEVILIHPSNENISYTYHAPRNEGIEYDDVNIQYNTQSQVLRLNGQTKKEYVFIIRDINKVNDVKGAESWFYNRTNKELQIFADGKNLEIQIK